MDIVGEKVIVDKKVFSSKAWADNNTAHLVKGTQEGGDVCVGRAAGRVVMVNIVGEIQSLPLK